MSSPNEPQFFARRLPDHDHLQDAQMYFWRIYRERYGGPINKYLMVPMWKLQEMRRAHGRMHGVIDACDAV
jgi:hypothetical protein